MAQFPDLNTYPRPQQTQRYQYAQYIRMPNDPVVHRLVPFQRLGMAVLHFLALQRSTITQAEAERTLALFGPPGVGKTEGALAATLREGIAVMSISASMFASEVEGGAVQILEALLAEMERWSREHGIDIVLMLDDLDLSILAQDETQDIGATINTQLLLNRFHKLAEERHLYRTVSGGPIPFIVTMNDPTVLRASLLREGRCMMFEHVPTTAEKIDIAYAVLNPRTASERELVAALVKKFAAKQSVAFWKSLRSRVIAHTHKKLLQDGLPSAAALDAAFRRPIPLNPELTWSIANNLRNTRARNYLKTRSFFRH